MSSLKPTAVIAEDEPVLRAQLGDMLRAVWPELVIATTIADGHQALRALEQHSPDVLFLDIQMPGLTGLDVARHASGRCHVVFVTAYDQYAVAAFEEGAVDYLMKPLNFERLVTACGHIRKRLSLAPTHLKSLLKTLTKRTTQTQPYLQ